MTVEQDVAVSVLAVTNTVSQSGPFNGAERTFLCSVCTNNNKKTFCEKSIRYVDLVFSLKEETNIS